MIKEIRELPPFIHFGFNRQEITVYKNEVITIWQDTILNNNIYDSIFLTASSSTIVETKNNSIKLYFTATGEKNVSLFFEASGVKFPDSNTIKVNVVDITSDSNKITADSNKVTADGTYIL
jgi:hypothetical protein